MCISRPCLTLFESTRRRTAACCVKAWPGSLTDAPTQGKSLFIITLTNSDHNSLNQCSGSSSGSVGSVCVLVSWILIRIRNVFVQIRIVPSASKKMKKNLDFYRFVTYLWLFIFEEWSAIFVRYIRYSFCACIELLLKIHSGMTELRDFDRT